MPNSNERRDGIRERVVAREVTSFTTGSSGGGGVQDDDPQSNEAVEVTLLPNEPLAVKIMIPPIQ